MSGIPDIGVVFDTNISISASDHDIEVGQTVTFKGVLYAYYLNESSGNLDFCNTFDEVTVKVYRSISGGYEQIGSVTSDSNGEFVYELTPETEGILYLRFGVDDASEYNGATSSTVSVVVSDVAPSYEGVVVSSSEDILSYYDGDECTISAQLVDSNDDPVAVEGVTVYLYKDSVLWDTLQTDNTGKVTKTYQSTGVGDVEFEATDGTLSSETYGVQDCLFYDDATSNKVSNYNTVNNTLTWSTDHYESVASSTSSTSNYFAFTNPKASLGLPKNIEVELDIQQTGNLNGQWGVSFTDSQNKTTSTKYAACGAFTNQKGIICNSPWGSQRTDGTLSLNTWYHLKLQVNGTTVSLELKQGDTVLFNDTLTVSFMSSLTYLNVHQGQSSNTIQFKNLKIKPL